MFKDYTIVIESIEYLYRKTCNRDYLDFIEFRIDTKELYELLLDLKDYVNDYLNIDNNTFFNNFRQKDLFNKCASIPNKYKHKVLTNTIQKKYDPEQVKHQGVKIEVPIITCIVNEISTEVAVNTTLVSQKTMEDQVNTLESLKIEKYQENGVRKELTEVITVEETRSDEQNYSSKVYFRISFTFKDENYETLYDSRDLSLLFIQAWNEFLEEKQLKVIAI